MATRESSCLKAKWLLIQELKALVRLVPVIPDTHINHQRDR